MTGGDTPEAMTLAAAFEEHVDAHPEVVALVDGDRRWTYRELDDAADRVARRIVDRAPATEAPHVGVLLGQSAEAIIAGLAVAKAGRVAVMLDPATPAARLRELLVRVTGIAVVTDADHRHALDRCDDLVRAEIDVGVAHEVGRVGRLGLDVDPDAGAGITFTSGSTGEPKGVVRSHRSLVGAARRQIREGRYQAGDRVGLVFEYQFAAGRSVIVGTLLAEATLDVFDVRHRGAKALAGWLVDHRVSSIAVSASLVQSMLDSLDPDTTFPELCRITFTADVLRRPVVEALRARLGPDAIIANLYGSSEAGGIARFTIRADTVLEGDLVPVGRPREHVVVAIDQPDRDGVGEIVVTSPNVALGYVGDADDGAFSSADGDRRTFRTGDLGRLLPDGTLEYRGRIDHRLKVRGHAVDPAEVEAALRQLDAVDDAVVVLSGSGGRRSQLVAYVVAGPGGDVSVGSLRRGLRELLPSYMIPTRFVTLDALPRTPRGKLDRAALPAPPAGRPDVGTPYAAPVGPTEQVVADVFARLLDVDRVGRHDEFFDLGGDSLTAAEAMTVMSAALGRDLPLSVFLDASTPAALAARFDAVTAGAGGHLVTLSPGRPGGRPGEPDSEPAPIVCIHGGGGEVLSFAGLAAALPPDRPFVGVQMSSGDKARRLFATRRVARAYADELHRAGLAPRIVAGHSYGGLLALEATRRLVELGHRVDTCVLIDTPRPDRRALLRRLLTGRRPDTAVDTVDLAWAKELLYAMHAASGLRPRPHRLTTERMIAALWGTLAFRVRPVPTRLVVIRAERTTADLERWRTATGGSFELVTVGGDHLSILLPPHVHELAAVLHAELAAPPSARHGTGGT